MTEQGLGAFREAADLVQEASAKLPEAWQRLVEVLHDLLHRAHRLGADPMWAAIAGGYDGEIHRAITTVDAWVARLNPAVAALVETLARTAARSVPVLALFDSAITLGAAAGHLAQLPADMAGRGELETWSGRAREAYDRRVHEQAGAADAAAAEVAASARWLAGIGAANIAYVTNVGHLGADLVARLAAAAVEAGAAAAGDVARLVTTLDRVGEVIESSAGRIAGWARDLQEHFAATLARADVPTFGAWPSAGTMA